MSSRAGKFFSELMNKIKNPDANTGLGQNNFEGENNITKFDKDNKIVSQETQKFNYNVIESQHSPGTFINYLGNSTANNINPFVINEEHQNDISLENIIEYTNKEQPSLSLSAHDFVYHKDFGTKPANRLIVLRRFKGPVPHDIFGQTRKPIATIASYYDLDESPIKLNFSEIWKQFDGTFLDVLQDVVGIKFSSLPGLGSTFSKMGSSPLGQDLMYKIGQKLGITTNGPMPYGDANLIHEASVRNPDGEGLSTGLKCDISIDIEQTYVFNEIKGISGRVHMIEMLGIFTSMGTSPGRFLLTNGGSTELNSILNAIKNGEIDVLIDKVKEALSLVIDNAISSIVATVEVVKEKVTTEGLQTAAREGIEAGFAALSDLGSSILKQRYSRYKWKLIGAVSAMNGNHTTPWHISLGNPKFPWFVCGNMVVEDIDVSFGGELSYDDIFTEVTVKIKLKNGRAMGSHEIQSLFQIGKGRIYDKPDKINRIVVPQNTEVINPGVTETTSKTETNNIPKSYGDDYDAYSKDLNMSDHSLDNKSTRPNILAVAKGVVNKITSL